MKKDYNESDLLGLIETILVPATAFRPCSTKESLLLMPLILSELQHDPISEEIKSQFMYRLIEKRSKLYDYSMSEHAITLIASISPSPGIAVIYMTYMQYIASKRGIKKYTVSKICEEVIPYGVIKSEVLERFWDAQKAAGAPLDNMVDDIDCIKYIANHEKVR